MVLKNCQGAIQSELKLKSERPCFCLSLTSDDQRTAATEAVLYTSKPSSDQDVSVSFPQSAQIRNLDVQQLLTVLSHDLNTLFRVFFLKSGLLK